MAGSCFHVVYVPGVHVGGKAMGFHSGFERVNGDVVKSTLDVQEDPQSVLTVENRFFNVTNNPAKSYVTRVTFPEGMLVVMHRRG